LHRAIDTKQDLFFGSFKMAKQRRNNTAASALTNLLSTIGTVAKVELADNPEALAEVIQMTEGIADSNFITAAEHLDDSIETKHQVDEVLEAGGVDPVQHGRDGALAGAEMVVEFEQARLAEPEQEQDEPEQEQEEPKQEVVGTPPDEE
jgi:hypothetical protein